MSEKELVILHRSRGQQKRKLTDFQKFLMSLKQRDQLCLTDIKELETRIECVQPVLENFESIQNQICQLKLTEEDEKYASEFENLFFSVMAEAKSLLDESLPKKQEISSSASSSNSSNSNKNSNSILRGIKLPTITLPKFGGQYIKWLEFHDTFTSLIHQNEPLNDIQKFHYLRASLEGDAADIIKSLQLSAANYIIAWNLLCDRYTNKKLLIQKHIGELFQLRDINRESAINLREISDSVTKHLRSLQALGQPTGDWDAIVIYLVTSKLDKQTARDWECYKTTKELPTFEELKTFLNTKADMLDNLNMSRGEFKHQKQMQKVNKTFAVSTVTCYYCKGSHGIYNCENFLKLSVNERIQKIKDLKLCSNCLRHNHVTKDCKSRTRECKICKKFHNSLLHVNNSDQTTDKLAQSLNNQVSLSAQVSMPYCQVLLATAQVKVKDNSGKWHLCRALLDSASQSSFITSELQCKLKIEKYNVDISIQGINQVMSPIKSQCNIKLKSCVNKFETNLKCLVIDKISDNIPSVSINTDQLRLPENLQLADPSYDTPGKIDILIGAQLFWSLITQGQIQFGKNNPVIQNTKLGWILSGPLQINTSENVQCYFTKNLDIQLQLQRFWELEECPAIRKLSLEEQKCESYFQDNVAKDKTGRFIVSIPLKESTDRLGESKSVAEKRFHLLEKRLNANPQLREAYLKFMSEYLSLGHMSKIDHPDDILPYFYMPHHGVINESSRTTRLRVVFDGSCQTSSGISFNDIQQVGPSLQSDLFNILVRFRQHQVVFSADIQKMYRQILIKHNERKFQRILWREDSSQPVDTFELNTVTYGTKSAPYLATRCLIQIAEECESEFPEACSIIKSDFYVDDVLSGGNSIEEVSILCMQIATVLQKAHFKLHKWVSNQPQVFTQFDFLKSSSNEIYIGSSEMTKTLGLYWLPSCDTLNYKVTPNSITTNITKRHILSTISQVFDPLGLLSPTIIIGKTILQLLWQEKLNWDDIVPKHIKDKWDKLQNELNILNSLKIPRHIVIKGPIKIELHGFSDASETAYCACVYARSINTNGTIYVHLISAKSKVAPLKTLTIPRLELCGAHLLSKLVITIKQSLRLNIDKTFLWSDSTIVLGWINTSPSLLKVFVSHRIAEIQSNTENDTWLHVPSLDNPADLGSRGMFPEQLKKSTLWWNGPDWLKSRNQYWPSQVPKITIEQLPEVKRIEITYASSTLECPIHMLRFSNYDRLIRSVAYCFRFINNCRKDNSKRLMNYLTVDELDQALNYVIKVVQGECFFSEIQCIKSEKPLHQRRSKIINLNPFIDSKGILRVGGRLHLSDLSFTKKHPIILPRHHFSKLLFLHEHTRLSHAGSQQLLASLRDKYWPLNGKNYARLTIHQCIKCFRCKPKNINPLMGNLPTDRVTQAHTFQITGVDYAGPLTIKDRIGRGSKTTKCYVALFICFVTKAMHIELVSSLSTEAFLASLKRFIARRGKSSKIYSDNGCNFVGANNELRQVIEGLKSDEPLIKDKLAIEGISWIFIPPNSPHFGGLWEAGVKGVKFHLKRVAGNSVLTFEQLYTLLTQIESVLNSRPITQMSSDPNDLEPLTPSHFLIGRKLTSIPEQDLLHVQQNRLSNFQQVQQLFQQFWSRWKGEYLHSLQQRKKWFNTSPSIEIGTMVLLQLDDAPSLYWPVGRITEVFAGKDGVVRVVCVKTSKGVYKRSVTKVFPLPIVEGTNTLV